MGLLTKKIIISCFYPLILFYLADFLVTDSPRHGSLQVMERYTAVPIQYSFAMYYPQLMHIEK